MNAKYEKITTFVCRVGGGCSVKIWLKSAVTFSKDKFRRYRQNSKVTAEFLGWPRNAKYAKYRTLTRA